MINITLLKSSNHDEIFTESAKCLQISLRTIGLVSEIHINAVNTTGYTIFFGAGLRCSTAVFREIARKKSSAIFNLEQLMSRETVVDQDYLNILSEYPMLDYHSANVDYIKSVFQKTDCFEIPLIPNFDLVNKIALISGGGRSDCEASDFLFYGSLNARRLAILQSLLKCGYRVKVITEGKYACNLTEELKNTKAVLHIHYHETALFPAARFLQPMILGVPIICEESVFSIASDYTESGILFGSYQNLVSICEEYMSGAYSADSLARKTFEQIARIDFKAKWEQFCAVINPN